MRHFISALAAAALLAGSPAHAAGAPVPYSESRDPDYRGRSLECLTQAIYYEARNQSEEGQRAVAQVVLNRVQHPSYPDTVCSVVFQGSERTTGCQFSFTCDGSMNAGVSDGRAWDRAERIARAALSGSVYRPVGLALNYHTTAIRPYWAPSLVRQAVVGDHIFYRRPNPLESYTPAPTIRVEEPEWSPRDSATLRRVLRNGRTAPPLQEIAAVIEEIPVVETQVRFRTLGSSRGASRSAARAGRPQSRPASVRRIGPRIAVESGVRVSRGS